MGEVRVKVELSNAVDEGLVRRGLLRADQVRKYSADALVDTGAIASVRIPPTKLVDRSYSAYKKTVAYSSRIPPTKLVDRSYSAYKSSSELRGFCSPINAVWWDSEWRAPDLL